MVRIYKNPLQPPLLLMDMMNGAVHYPNDLSGRTMAQLRRRLLVDQGYICCYCQKRIPHKRFFPKSKIEHFRCQTNYPNLQLEFSNLFISCNGIGTDFTCDTKKDDSDINSFNLITSDFTTLIKYTSSGIITSTNGAVDNDINNILNLNDQNLRKARSEIKIAIDNIKKKCNKRGNYNQRINKIIAEWSTKNIDGKYKSFYGVALYYLK